MTEHLSEFATALCKRGQACLQHLGLVGLTPQGQTCLRGTFGSYSAVLCDSHACRHCSCPIPLLQLKPHPQAVLSRWVPLLCSASQKLHGFLLPVEQPVSSEQGPRPRGRTRPCALATQTELSHSCDMACAFPWPRMHFPSICQLCCISGQSSNTPSCRTRSGFPHCGLKDTGTGQGRPDPTFLAVPRQSQDKGSGRSEKSSVKLRVEVLSGWLSVSRKGRGSVCAQLLLPEGPGRFFDCAACHPHTRIGS